MEQARCVIRRETTPAGPAVRVHVTGSLDRAAHAELRRALRRAFEQTRRAAVLVDLTEVDDIGSECIEVLLVAYTRALRGGHGFEVAGARGAVRQALEITGLCPPSALYAPNTADTLDAMLDAGSLLPVMSGRPGA
ncbi:STAS domain-containing protein [Actinoplanes aureus]|uniref:STAS domain-containing protein n=1 Tax=Actinoplanes aureus TaxID=2792083 RepID=A0A931CHJ5_9ACTN|nr:STAS domain-containing protein [Actinoplanes aureus]MBG0567291.1 STAS domain-containing protein [Actinoplanes aureus]